MIVYTVIPLGGPYEPQDFNDPYDAEIWRDELAMLGVKASIVQVETPNT